MAYKKKADLAAEYDISTRTVHRIYKLIEEQMGKRYRRDVIINTGKIIRIDEDVFRDALRYRELIIRGIAPKYHKYAV